MDGNRRLRTSRHAYVIRLTDEPKSGRGKSSTNGITVPYPRVRSDDGRSRALGTSYLKTREGLDTLERVRRIVERLDVAASPVRTYWDMVLTYEGSVNVRMCIKGKHNQHPTKVRWAWLDFLVHHKASHGLILATILRYWMGLFQHEAMESLRIWDPVTKKWKPVVDAHEVRDLSGNFDIRKVFRLS